MRGPEAFPIAEIQRDTTAFLNRCFFSSRPRLTRPINQESNTSSHVRTRHSTIQENERIDPCSGKAVVWSAPPIACNSFSLMIRIEGNYSEKHEKNSREQNYEKSQLSSNALCAHETRWHHSFSTPSYFHNKSLGLHFDTLLGSKADPFIRGCPHTW